VRVTILGGGGFWVPLICKELRASKLAVDEVVLYDTSPGRLQVIADVLAGYQLPRSYQVSTTTDLGTALHGTSLIFSALRVGGLDGRVRDERTAHGLGLMCAVKSCERDIITASITGSSAAALRAFALHPLVGSLSAARALAAPAP
jgi:alpha-galactosidase/6-phospho-beta-glucosidase family protein